MTLVAPTVTGPWYARLARLAGPFLLRWSRRRGARWVVPEEPPELDLDAARQAVRCSDIIESKDGRILMPRPMAFSRPLEGAPYCEYGWWVPGTTEEIVRQLMPEPRHQESRRV